MIIGDADVQVTEYTVSVIPEDRLERDMFEIKVAYRGRGLWAVTLRGRCLSNVGEWSWERQPSSRTDEWLADHRFELDHALRLAADAAPRITVNGTTAAQAMRDTDSYPDPTPPPTTKD